MNRILQILLVLILIGAGVAYYGYNMIFSNNVNSDKPVDIFIPTNSSYEDVVDILKKQNVLKNIGAFENVSSLMKYKKEHVPTGKYTLKPGQNTREIVSMLRAGAQSPVNLTFNNARTLSELAGDLSKNIELDSLSILDYISNADVQKKYGLKKQTMMSLFIPNTYQVYWNTSREKLIDRLAKEQKKFWTESRIAQAKKQNLTPEQAYTLASIVQKESVNSKEQPTIAGLYLNRLRRGIPLEADPTLVFANNDFTIRRVLNKHKKVDSPYNTYKYSGLPPGPIGMSSINAIKSVLNPESHNYIFMCAKPGYQSLHAFAKNLSEHNRNARAYHKWLDEEGIK